MVYTGHSAMVNSVCRRISFLTSFKLGFTCTWGAKHFKESECQSGRGTPEAHLAHLGCDPGAMVLEKDTFRWNELKSLT